MLSIACGLAESRGAEGLVIAAHAGDHTIYPDCRENFLGPMAQAMESGTYAHIKLLRPFVAMDKTAKTVTVKHVVDNKPTQLTLSVDDATLTALASSDSGTFATRYRLTLAPVAAGAPAAFSTRLG